MVIFTFYCIFRIKYVHEKYLDVMSKKPPTVVLITQQSFDSSDSTDPTNSVSIPTQATQATESTQSPILPIITEPKDIIAYMISENVIANSR